VENGKVRISPVGHWVDHHESCTQGCGHVEIGNPRTLTMACRRGSIILKEALCALAEEALCQAHQIEMWETLYPGQGRPS
jgi:hypothetical protein